MWGKYGAVMGGYVWGQGQGLTRGGFCGSVWLALVGLVLVWLGGCSGLVGAFRGIVRGLVCFGVVLSLSAWSVA